MPITVTINKKHDIQNVMERLLAENIPFTEGRRFNQIIITGTKKKIRLLLEDLTTDFELKKA